VSHVEVTGTGEVAAALVGIGDRLDDPIDALKDLARLGAAQLAAAAPRRTGRLARSIQGRRIGGRAVITAGNADVKYAPFPAYGTREMAADPFLRRVDSTLTGQARQRIEQDIDDEINRSGLT
jgi:hypothetical protein